MAKKNTSVDDDMATEPEETIDAEPELTPEAEPEAPEPERAEEPAPAVTAEAAPEQELPEPLPEKDPGKVLGIVGLIIALGVGVVGVVIGFLAYRRSRAVGFGGGFGMAAMIIGVVTTVLLVTQLTLLANGMGIGGACDGLRAGVHTLDNGTTISCT